MHFSKQKLDGSITLVALSLAVVIGISLGSYLALCSQAQQFSTRTVQLNRARQLAESALEEALWALNNNWTSAPWTFPTANDSELVIADVPWGEGVTGVATIRVENFNTSGPNTFPTITATGTITVPRLGVFSKTLRATTKPAPLFANAIGIVDPLTNPTSASGTYAVIFNGGGLVDSWDSDYLGNAPLGPLAASTPNRDFVSTTNYPGTNPGTIPSPQNPYPVAVPSTYPDLSFNYAAVIAAPNIRLNDAEIRGYVLTFGNAIGTNSNSKVQGPSAAATPPNLDQARIGKSAFIPNFPVAPPGGSYDNVTIPSSLINSGDLFIGVAGASVAAQYFLGSNLHLEGPSTRLVIQGPVVIWVAGDLELWLQAKIDILSTGRLEMFVAGNIQIGGVDGSSAQFVNQTNEPKKLALYSTNTGSRNFIYYSKKDFCGVMYSASINSKVVFRPIPSPDPERNIYGAILAKYNVEFANGTNSQIHYDTALQYLPKGWFKGVTTPFIIVQVTEL